MRLPPQRWRCWQKALRQTETAAVQATATNLLGVVRPALVQLETCLRQAKSNQRVLEVNLREVERLYDVSLVNPVK